MTELHDKIETWLSQQITAAAKVRSKALAKEAERHAKRTDAIEVKFQGVLAQAVGSAPDESMGKRLQTHAAKQLAASVLDPEEQGSLDRLDALDIERPAPVREVDAAKVGK